MTDIAANILAQLGNHQSKKKYRIVMDGNDKYRIQYYYAGGAQIGQITWTFDPREFNSAEAAEYAIKECYVVRVIKEIN